MNKEIWSALSMTDFSPQAATEASSEAPTPRRHPEQFGPLAGSVRLMGDVEHPLENEDAWTCDYENLKR